MCLRWDGGGGDVEAGESGATMSSFYQISEKPHEIENPPKYSTSLHERFCTAKTKQNKIKTTLAYRISLYIMLGGGWGGEEG